MTSTILTVEEVAGRLKISPRQVRRLINERRIGHVRIGKRLRVVPEEELESFIDREIVPVRTERGGEL